MMNVPQLVAEVFAKNASHKDQTEKLQALMGEILQLASLDERLNCARALVDNVINEHVSLVVARAVLTELCDRLQSGAIPKQVARGLAEHLLACVQPRAISYEEQVCSVRRHLATLLEDEEDWRGAAKMMCGIPLETGQRQYSPETKMETYVKIAQLFLEDGDSVEAEAYVNRASLLQAEVKDNTLLIKYQAQYARVLDCRRKFVEAAQRYYELSFKTTVGEAERIEALRHAVNCTVLASAGQRRARMLATLFKDERCGALREYSMLHKMYLDRIIRPDELGEYEPTLQEHQRARTSEGWTILQRAVIEHNLLAASKLYTNVSFEELGKLLNITAEKAEEMASTLIESASISGHIDQMTSTIHFADDGALAQWDRQLASLCLAANDLADRIAAEHPEWAAAQM